MKIMKITGSSEAASRCPRCGTLYFSSWQREAHKCPPSKEAAPCAGCGKPTTGRWHVRGAPPLAVCGDCLQTAQMAAPKHLRNRGEKLLWLKTPAGRAAARECRAYSEAALIPERRALRTKPL